MTKKQEVKSSKKDFIEKCIKTTEYLIVPVTTVASIWGADIGVYVAAFSGMAVSILTFIKLFIK